MPDRAPKRFRKAKAPQAVAGPSTSKTSPKTSTARLFAPFRALGYVTNDVPFSIFVHTPSGALATPSVNLVTSVGRNWMMWNAADMTLLFVGPELKSEIRSIAQTGTEVFVSAGDKIIKFVRGKQTHTWTAPGGVQVGKLLLFGDQLLALKHDGTGLLIFDLHSSELENEIPFHSSFTATTLLHPATYLNKVLIGSQQGDLQLWNTRTCSLIHTFPRPSRASPSAITAIVQSPAIDVIGIGHLDGTVRIFDIRQGEMIMQVRMEEGGVTDLAFRMDGPPVLATASSEGIIALWDLSKGGRIIHQQRQAHEQSVTGLEWVSGQPLLISSSPDNSVKQWLFDSPTAVPRLLKFRAGHHAPPSLIRYYGDDGKQILTAGRDRSLRYTSVVRDSRSHELSQGQAIMKRAIGMGLSADELKLPQITAMSSSSTRSKDWDDVLTAHAEHETARTWRVLNKRIGSWRLGVNSGAVQAVCVTACGNFGLAGSSTGEIRMWNVQSGKERRSFALTGPAPGDTKSQIIAASKVKDDRARLKPKAPTKSMQAITGLVTDALNTTVIASTLEGKLYFFDFHTTQRVHEMQLDSSITALNLQRDNGLLAVICDDLVIRVVDIETRRIVRELRGFKGRILDSTFSPDSRWLIATSLDSVIRTFDIPTGRLVDAFRTLSIATSVTFSPTGDFLATAHVDSLGVHLWANRAQFSDVALMHINEEDEVVEVGLPTVQGVKEGEVIEGIEDIGAPEYTDIYTTPEQLTDGLMTLSLIPRSRWQTLLNIDTIKQRNKPKEPPKAPEKAPFFLPTVSGLETRFDLSAVNEKGRDDAAKRVAPLAFMESDFTRRLSSETPDGDYNAFFEYAKGLSPAALDLEIRSLVSLDHLSLFVQALTNRLKSHKDFEAVQAILSVFLTVHGDVLIANVEVREGLEALREEQKRESQRLRELVGYAMGTLGFLRSTG